MLSAHVTGVSCQIQEPCRVCGHHHATQRAFYRDEKPGTNLVVAARKPTMVRPVAASSSLKAVELANLTSPSLAEVITRPHGHPAGPKDAAPGLLVPTPCRSLGLITVNPVPKTVSNDCPPPDPLTVGAAVTLTNVVPTVGDRQLKRFRAATAQQLNPTRPHEPPPGRPTAPLQ
jgi:hypothetical protein